MAIWGPGARQTSPDGHRSGPCLSALGQPRGWPGIALGPFQDIRGTRMIPCGREMWANGLSKPRARQPLCQHCPDIYLLRKFPARFCCSAVWVRSILGQVRPAASSHTWQSSPAIGSSADLISACSGMQPQGGQSGDSMRFYTGRRIVA